jgi:protein-disulfide isomerase
LIRQYARLASASALVVLSLSMFAASAQENPPEKPTAQPMQVPAAPAPAPVAAPVFPPPNPEFFTATTPTKEVINSFLQTSWGYDENRVWQIQAIMKTPVEGISKVVVLIGDKTGKQKLIALQFFALADGKHIIAGDEILPFGAQPYADDRAKLEQEATGPYRGAAAKDLELVEFADFQCPHCKEAQANMDKLLADFPKARIVFQNYPLARIHPEAAKAAVYGVCVTKEGGSSAFFQFASAVFDGQDGLATADGTTLTLNSAVTKAGLDPAKVAACAATPAAVTEVENSVKLAQSLNVMQTPTLMVNGRQVPIGGVPYDTLKKIIEYQAKLDGVTQ